MNSPKDKTASIHVFGCQMNKLDGELVSAVLADRGYTFTAADDEAGLILFVTCSVRQHAEERVHSRLGALKGLKKQNPDLVIGILGCMAQEHGSRLFDKHRHLDVVCGTRDFQHVADLVERVRSGESQVAAVESAARPEVVRDTNQRPALFSAYLGVMRGCNQFCSYCIVPFVRGREESRPADEVVDEARRLIDDGVKEITLLGQAVNRYDDGCGTRLAELLVRLDSLSGLKRLHFVTSYPSHVDDALIAAIRDCPTVTRFLHVPAQTGSNAILERMNRRYSVEDYVAMVDALRAAVPDMEFGSDFIAGFPGESDDDFNATVALLERVRFQQSFIFKYSPRPGTLAAKKYTDDVPDAVKRDRNARLLAVQEAISIEKNAALVGAEVEVLVTGRSRRDENRFTGRTVYNNIAAFRGEEEMIGRFARLRVARTTALTLLCDDVPEVVD